jgi:hypothetical protein
MDTRVLKNAEDFKNWDNLVDTSLHGTIFHRSSWINTSSKSLNKVPKIYGCFEDNQLIGGCSLFVNNLKFHKLASSVIEMTPYGGIVLAKSLSDKLRQKERRYRKIIRSLCKALGEEHFDYIELIGSPDFFDVRPFTWNNWNSDIRYTYYLALFDGFPGSYSQNVRRDIKKAVDNHITIKQMADSSIFYDLFCKTFIKQDLRPPVPKRFIDRTIDLLKSENLGEMWVAETSNGDIASTEIVLWDRKRAYRWAAASDPQYLQTGAVTFLLSSIFQSLKNKGFKEINLMAANTPNLSKFISGFNPNLLPYHKVYKYGKKYRFTKRLIGLEKNFFNKINGNSINDH